ncbi:MAG: hypothetical protein NTV19_21610 [Burkholderiales bacterium]|nr:hypothetical protein [Burkholderiales bacterium]
MSAVTTERATLLIADIGGYTDYMGSHRMTLAHAEVNTARMLDRMVDAAPGFELVEIEGDAAFLSRRVGASDDGAVGEILGAAGSPADLAQHLLERALFLGGHDNVTALVLEVARPVAQA